nr:CPXCG motif-containing cysteine-rich protein [Parahaliea mediterranea]
MAITRNPITCPYCGESIDVLIDQQDAGDQYIEDCQVCCQPIVFTLMIDEAGEPTLTVQAENDV